MLSWLPRRRARMARIDHEAEAMIRDFGAHAYYQARQREHEASSEAIAEDWGRIAVAVAEKVGRRIGLKASTRLAMNAAFAPDREQAGAREEGISSEPRTYNDLTPTLGGKTLPYRIQFARAEPDLGTSTLNEVEIEASDVSAAIIAAANIKWPRDTIGLRIFDRDGHEVFARHKTKRR